MWTIEVTRKTIATKEQIWKLWTDVSNWKVWDKDVESSELFGEFRTGSKGVLKSVGGPETKFVLIESEPLKSFTNRSFPPLCTVDFIHKMKETEDAVEITHKVVMTGFLTFLFSRIIGKNIEKGLPVTVEKLVELAENKDNKLF
ncbi:MAG: hypothetical protein LBS43_07670 [Prevotellaceae bacterium]|jgi:hypothetical protein|nr:hypothetical protein [Prevotellaceae bacterium]